jgi:putative copper resistance protein D
MSLQLPLLLCAALHAAALMAWFGTLLRQRALGLPEHSRQMLALRLAGGTALASAACWPFLLTGSAMDDPGAALDPRQLALVLGQTSFGQVCVARTLLVAVAASRLPTRRAGEASTLLPVGAALASIGFLGHAAGVAGIAGLGQRLVLAAHLLAAGAWLGLLPWLWLAARGVTARALARALRRFSRLGVWLVAVVVVSGCLNSWWRLGGVAPLWSSGYGQIVLLKVALVLLMGVCALCNRNVFTPAVERLEAEEPAAAGKALRGLRWSLALETLLGAAVLVAAFFLGSAEAPS